MKPHDGGGGEVIKFNDVVATMLCLNVLKEDITTYSLNFIYWISSYSIGPS